MVRRIAAVVVCTAAAMVCGCMHKYRHESFAPTETTLQPASEWGTGHAHGPECGNDYGYQHFWYDLPGWQYDLPYHPQPPNVARPR